ncbi:MAG: site-specific DNA-methyltransferase [Gammaproteobacteria bacterium]|nr:site-specific DNA-methyltransferase [Gammaproteobacteria bacterium]
MLNKTALRDQTTTQKLLQAVFDTSGLDPKGLAQYLGTSYFSVVRWERGDIEPGTDVVKQLRRLLADVKAGRTIDLAGMNVNRTFASRGIRQASEANGYEGTVVMRDDPGPYLLSRLRTGSLWSNSGQQQLAAILSAHANAAQTVAKAVAEGVSAGKNTYTYDAHTYHTKVPPQGIAQVLRKYLPADGLILDPFAGSGMTGVAARTTGHDVILNELSPAASFIADRFTSQCDPAALTAAVKTVTGSLAEVRKDLYTTQCRACAKDTELLFTVWSYKVTCSECGKEFVLWDECRRYGKTVREHKFLREFPCPHCKRQLKKSRLARTNPVPVLVGYKCCSKVQSEVPPSDDDLKLIASIEADQYIAADFVPDFDLPAGVNLSQPKRHGLTNIKNFYTARNLAAMSQLWKAIHRIEDTNLAAFLGFVFTSLYQRVTKLSEYRFWGGSGNTANFNVPYIFNEANVFVTFERKARSIIDHLETTAHSYTGRCLVNTGSATNLSFLPDSCVDLIFTDPPFGANINYSEMNMLWESWLKVYTDTTNEAIVNRVMKKDARQYQDLMTQSLKECYRVLRPGHWLVLVFMNSAKDIWDRIRRSVLDAGFTIERIDIFDKQHGTFKQFVSDNTAGADLMLHCQKPTCANPAQTSSDTARVISVRDFLNNRSGTVPVLPYLHVRREADIDYRTLYSEYLADSLLQHSKMLDFATFRSQAMDILENNEGVA